MFIGIRTLGTAMLAATALPFVLATVAPGLERLATMPPATRLELADRLERFDRLPAAEQRAIRELDEALDRLDPDERRRYLDLMRRFGSWARGLDDESRRELESAPPERRLALVRDRLGPVGSPESPGLDPALWVRSDTFNPVPLYDAAALLRVWSLLDEPGRRRVESARALDGKLAMLRQLGRERGIQPSPDVRETFRALLDDLLRRTGPAPLGARLGAEVGDLPSWMLDPLGSPPARPADGEGDPGRRLPSPGDQAEPPRNAAQPPEPPRNAAQPRLTPFRLAMLRLAEVEYLLQLRSGPESATPGVLLTFESRLPDWYRGTIDPLPPEMARHRLRALHRLLLVDPEIQRWLSATVPTAAPGSPGRDAPAGGGQPPLGTPF